MHEHGLSTFSLPPPLHSLIALAEHLHHSVTCLSVDANISLAEGYRHLIEGGRMRGELIVNEELRISHLLVHLLPARSPVQGTPCWPPCRALSASLLPPALHNSLQSTVHIQRSDHSGHDGVSEKTSFYMTAMRNMKAAPQTCN